MTRAGKERIRAARLHNPSQIHDDNSICHLANDGEVMSDEDHRESEIAMQRQEQVQDLTLH
jgi:hypothetical protein